MQLKGLVRFFTIVLIVISIYQLSFTWLVRNHEKKMEAQADQFVKSNYPSADQKYPGNKELQAAWEDTLSVFNKQRLQRLLDSTKDVTISYGISGKINYQQAKENELNLGLDLQGGMNVTLEVEMTGLIKALAKNSKDPVFLKAIQNANNRKANSDANFITLFADEYKKLNPTGHLSTLFAGGSTGKITFQSSDNQVVNYLSSESKDAFDNTFRVLRTRIDQFGVAQPNINPDRDRGIISVELAGVQDKERVRKYLQSSANLQFWELYNIGEIGQNIDKAEAAYAIMMGGAKTDSTQKEDSTNQQQATTKQDSTKDSGILSKELGSKQSTTDTANTQAAAANDPNAKSLRKYIEFIPASRDDKGNTAFSAAIGSVLIKDSSIVRSYLDNLNNNFPADLVWMYGVPSKDKEGVKTNRVLLYAVKTQGREQAKVEGDVITDAKQDFDPTTGEVQVEMRMNTAGTRVWGEMTREAFNKGQLPIAIALDNIIYSAPHVRNAIENGISSISGGFTPQEAQDLANILKAGKLPAPAKIVQEQIVGPTLGADAIRGGSMAFFISFIVIFTLMLVYYNTSGWIANIALILNLLFTVGVLSSLHATLTAPGIAGLVLTIGMAVDTNVIIYERIKEELTRGKGYQQAINDGYRRSLPPVLDAHVTTLLTAIILFYFGLGPVKGFATTQIIGILLSLFCGILVSRWVTDWFTSKKRHLEYFTGISRRVFKHASFKFIEYRKIAYGISVVVLCLGIGSFFNGFDEGVEFKGGRSFTVDFRKPVNVEQVRKDLEVVFGESPVIKTVGSNNELDITTSYLINDTRQESDSLVEAKMVDGLKNHLPQNLSFAKFDSEYKLGSKKVLPTISDDLKKGAKWATFWSLLIIAIYIFIRFRDWRYSVGTIVALLHDVLVTLAVFSFLKNIVPFPLEIDQHFIAAILTVIGFSMNDTVIVFDRIREDSRLYPNASRTEVINRAINETLSRTIMTSLTVFLTILILFIVGGEVTRGFAFAMLIGIVTGTYSSIFVAAPVLVDLARKRPLGKANLVPDEKHKPAVKPATVK